MICVLHILKNRIKDPKPWYFEPSGEYEKDLSDFYKLTFIVLKAFY